MRHWRAFDGSATISTTHTLGRFDYNGFNLEVSSLTERIANLERTFLPYNDRRVRWEEAGWNYCRGWGAAAQDRDMWRSLTDVFRAQLAPALVSRPPRTFL